MDLANNATEHDRTNAKQRHISRTDKMMSKSYQSQSPPSPAKDQIYNKVTASAGGDIVSLLDRNAHGRFGSCSFPFCAGHS